jgi:alkylation response protein AidB-like acyl-CoA dehydrogenase
MNLEFSEEQLLFAQAMERFLEKEYDFERRRASLASPHAVNVQVWQGLADLGLLSLPFPESAGGLGCGLLETGLAMEVMGRHLVVEPVVPAMLAGGLLARLGDAGQHARWLAPLMIGAARIALAHDEFDDGISTVARRSGDGWRLHGAKSMVAGAPGAGSLIVSARDEMGTLRLLVVTTASPGVTITPVRLLDASLAADITLDDVPVAASELLDGDAQAALVHAGHDAMVMACWEAVGAMCAALAQTISYVKQREQFGRPLAAFQVVQHTLAEMVVCCEEARAAALLAALADADDPVSRLRTGTAAKVKIARSADTVAKNSVQLHGGMGVSDELPIASYFRKLLAFETLSGTTRHHLAHYAAAIVGTGRHRDSIVLPVLAVETI